VTTAVQKYWAGEARRTASSDSPVRKEVSKGRSKRKSKKKEEGGTGKGKQGEKIPGIAFKKDGGSLDYIKREIRRAITMEGGKESKFEKFLFGEWLRFNW